MVRRDLTTGTDKPGIYLARVGAVTLKHSQESNHKMLKLRLDDAQTGRKLCDHFLMLEGKLLWAGNKQLTAFGLDGEAEEFDEGELLDKCAYVSLKLEDGRGDYGPKLAVNWRLKDSFAGFWPESSPPLAFGVCPLPGDDPAASERGADDQPDNTPF